MARGATLESLLTDLRAEVGQSTNPALGRNARDMLVTTIQRTQERLWQDYDWPHLRVRKDIQLQAGSRYYDFPTDIDIDRIEKIEIKYGSIWQPVSYGFDESFFAIHDSDEDQRSDPVERWREYSASQFEVWPMPATNGDATNLDRYLRVTGISNLSALVAESDTADLDDRLIVLYAAAEVLARQKATDAQAKLELANRHYARIRGRLGKRAIFGLGATDDQDGDYPRQRIRAVYGGFSGA